MAEVHATCVRCGVQFIRSAGPGRPRKFCSAECRSPANPTPRWADGVPECKKDFSCLVCGVTFKPKRAGRTKCCSRECGLRFSAWGTLLRLTCGRVWHRAVRRPKPQPAAPKAKMRQCVSCRRDFPSLGDWARCCSDECRAAVAAVAKVRMRERVRSSGAKAAARKAGKLRRRAAVVETVNPLVVLGRDGWRCHLCGVKTPKRLRGSYDDRAPEVDHIVPIAKGGEHSYRNTACACRRCNLAKLDAVRGQLRLF